MTLPQWYSNDSAWAIIRRGIVAVGIIVVLSAILRFVWGLSTWPVAFVPVVLTLIHLIGHLGKKKRHSDNSGK
jgi:fatty acid desaturase